MFARVVQKDGEVLVIGQLTREQSASNAMRSPRILKKYSKLDVEVIRQFCKKQGHTLIGGIA